MRGLIIGALILFLSACSSTKESNQGKLSNDFLIPIKYSAPTGQLYYLAYKPECDEHCYAQIMFNLREASISEEFLPFTAFAVFDETQKNKAQVGVRYDSVNKQFLLCVETYENGELLQTKVLSEHSLPETIQVTIHWSNTSLSVFPHVKEVGEGWLRFEKSPKLVDMQLGFNPVSYAYLASGMNGTFGLQSGKQNIMILGKAPIKVQPVLGK